LIADNRDLLADTVNTDPRLSHWPVVAAWWKERIKYVGPYGEHTTVVFDRSPWIRDWKEYTQHGLALILDACVYFFPGTNFALIDRGGVPRTCVPAQTPTSPIAPAHKRARSVDTGKPTLTGASWFCQWHSRRLPSQDTPEGLRASPRTK
jgi:hypothetical protein